MDYIKFLPDDIFISIVKTLDMVSLCNLTMSSKELNKLCNSNDIWIYHYFRTIQGKWKIKEDSVHIKGRNSGYITYLYEFTDGDNIVEVKSFNSPECQEIICKKNKDICYSRDNIKFIKSLGSLVSVATDPNKIRDCMKCQCDDILKAGFLCSSPNMWNNPDWWSERKIWRKDMINKWKAYNESVGLHCLCQDPTHYDIDTLDMPDSCKRFKSFKKVIIKKLYTQSKKDKFHIHVMRNENKKSYMYIQSSQSYIKYEKSKIESYKSMNNEENKIKIKMSEKKINYYLENIKKKEQNIKYYQKIISDKEKKTKRLTDALGL